MNKSMKICPICGTIFKQQKESQKYCSQKCNLVHLHTMCIKEKLQKSFICQNCGKAFTVTNSKMPGFRKFCSRHCSMSYIGKTNVGKKPPNYNGNSIPDHPCKNCGEMISRRRKYCSHRCYSIFKKGKSYEEINSAGVARKTGRILYCDRCGINIGYYKKSGIEGAKHHFCSAQCRELYHWASMTPLEKSEWLRTTCRSGNKKTRPEILMEEILDTNFPGEWKYTGDGSFFIEGYHPDFVCNDGKKIIEVYGGYWHADPKMYSDGDVVHDNKTAKQIWNDNQKRIDTFKQYGYSTLIFWDREIYKEQDQVIQTIKATTRPCVDSK
jgi:very-short-patch-repair endonuclease/endogenous inhibitor of DNA gyrase (YacG/DUF329 family)